MFRGFERLRDKENVFQGIIDVERRFERGQGVECKEKAFRCMRKRSFEG